MPRTARVVPGGFVYHVLNRSMGRMDMFRKESDFEAFEHVMVEAHLRQPIRILSYCVLVIALAGGTAGGPDGSRQRSFDREGIGPSAGEHRERTIIRRRDVGAANGKRSRVGADRSAGRPPMESERIGDRAEKLIARIPSSGQDDAVEDGPRHEGLLGRPCLSCQTGAGIVALWAASRVASLGISWGREFLKSECDPRRIQKSEKSGKSGKDSHRATGRFLVDPWSRRP